MAEWVHVRLAQNHMATTFKLTISCERSDAHRADSVLMDCHALIDKIETELSEYIPTSPIYRLNHSEPGTSVPISMTVFEVLERSEALRKLSAGAFSCTAKSVNVQSGQSTELIKWTRESVQRTDPGVHVGFGAIGKGYALDQVRKLIEQNGFTDFLLDGGGSSMFFSGFSAPGEPWDWAWSWERSEQGERLGLKFQHSTGRPIAIGVSGTEVKGNHILDPRSKGPEVEVPNKLQSALVACTSATDADALSTALFVSGWEESMPNFAQLTQAPAMAAIDRQKVPYWNGVFQSIWGAVSTILIAISFSFLAMPTLIPPAFAQDAMQVEQEVTVSSEDNGRSPAAQRKTAQESEGETEQAVDLSAMGLDSFNPYLVERDSRWVLLPIFTLLIILLHLKKDRAGVQNKRKGAL